MKLTSPTVNPIAGVAETDFFQNEAVAPQTDEVPSKRRKRAFVAEIQDRVRCRPAFDAEGRERAAFVEPVSNGLRGEPEVPFRPDQGLAQGRCGSDRKSTRLNSSHSGE